MVFCGNAFCAAQHSLDFTTTYIDNITEVALQNGIFDDIYVTKNVNYDYTTEMPTEWDFDTIFWAKFEGDLLAGNVNFALEQVDSVLIKRQTVGTGNWITLFQIPIEDIEDFNFSRLDKYVRSDTEYEYALIPVLNGAEGEMNINSILCQFDGMFIMEKDITYGSLIDIVMSSAKNRPSATINTIDSKYPYVVTNGNNNYYSGTTSAVFIRSGTDPYDWNFYDSWKYREDLMEFLCNGKPKILKHFDGRMYLVKIVDSPSQDESTNNYYPVTSFNWVEIGNAESSQDLYDNSLIDYNSRYNDIITGGEA